MVIDDTLPSTARMRAFLVCIHDATPAYARETRMMIRDLGPLIGRRFAFAVVPDWNGGWPLAAHRDYCRLVQSSSDELLLHGYFHRREPGGGLTSWLVERSDEMRGLDLQQTLNTLDRGQRVFTEVFGEPARGFLAPAWQVGHVSAATANTAGFQQVLGFFALDSHAGPRIPLATWTWDCGRWGWLGRVGHGIGWLSQSLHRGVPSLAIHPRDLARGYWPTILRLIQDLLSTGYAPSTVGGLLEGRGVEVAA